LDLPLPFQAINDSKATNPEAGIAALQCLASDEKAILLVGGRAKKTPLNDWAKLACEKASVIYCYGEDAHDFVDALEQITSSSPYFEVQTLDEAVALALAFQQTHPQDLLLLAPACASQDAFTDFEHRGRYFEDLVYKFFKRDTPT
jgi:UDP-N-acetylmuramoylalanine--D-glutamate ligase